MAMVLLNYIIRKCTARYDLSKSQEKINHLMYMDDIKLFAKNVKELETVIETVKIYNQDISMEYSIKRCAIGVELPNQLIRTFGEKETYKYSEMIEADTIKQ